MVNKFLNETSNHPCLVPKPKEIVKVEAVKPLKVVTPVQENEQPKPRRKVDSDGISYTDSECEDYSI